GTVIAKVPFCTTAEVNKVIEAAAAAGPEWANKPVVQRCQFLFKFRELLTQHAEEIARTVTREHGKTLVEARASVARGIEVVEFACGVPSLIMGQSIQNIAREVDCETIRHPVGAMPAHTPTGCRIVSQWTSRSMLWIDRPMIRDGTAQANSATSMPGLVELRA